MRGYIRYYKNREQQALLLKDEVESFRATGAPEDLRVLQERYGAIGIEASDWDSFLLRYSGDVDAALRAVLEGAQRSAALWRGETRAQLGDANTPLIAEGADLEKQPLALLEAEIARLQAQISVDRETSQRFASLSTRITNETETLTRLREKRADAEGAAGRLVTLLAERESSYRRVFEAVLGAQEILTHLYAPIREKLKTKSGTLRKLSFSIMRTADVDAWAARGELLLDLRRQGPFRGRGALCEAAREMLQRPWESGDAASVASAMKSFRDKHQSALLQHSPIPRTEQAEYRLWSRRFAQWLYGTEHISIRYSIDYDGTDIRKLSPGTRGIVLLLLYLALDDQDGRPLIIDQPEENLDPKSIYDELVDLFLDAKAGRQVIMVTHNANLVINTDADQIIIADAGPHPIGQLPPISYRAGGLEDPQIRTLVCSILEGGEHAFRERARRLRVRLDR